MTILILDKEIKALIKKEVKKRIIKRDEEIYKVLVEEKTPRFYNKHEWYVGDCGCCGKTEERCTCTQHDFYKHFFPN